MPNFELQGHVSLHVLDTVVSCRRCAQQIRMARKLAKRNPLNRWCAVPASTEPGPHQLPATSIHTCIDKRRTPLRSLRQHA